MGFKIKRKSSEQDIAKKFDGLATHNDVKKLEDRIRREKQMRILSRLSPRQRDKLAKIVAKRQGNGKE